MWTREEPYADPDEAMLRAADRWRQRFVPGRLRERVASLPAPRGRLHAPEAMAEADRLIAAAWRGAGWTVGRQRIRFRRVKGTADVRPGGRGGRWQTYTDLQGLNLVGIAEGESDEAVVLVAHHDTVRGSPGGDDNGAAVALLLELAAQLGSRRFRRTVVLATPDFEEIGLIGSRPLVRWLRSRFDVRAAVVFDPIGFMDARPATQRVPPGIDRLYPGQLARIRAREYRGDTVVGIYRRRSSALVRAWSRCLAATLGRDRVIQLRDPLDLPVVGPALGLHPVARNFSRSDHVHFWGAGLPAIHVTNTANLRNPRYHRPDDTPETLDYESLSGIGAAAALLIEELAA
jgi:hypothetical protein